MVNSPTLPSEIIISEILTRTSLETLGRCRAVCKEWNAETHGSSFMESHRSKNRNFWGYIIQTISKNNHFIDFVSPESKSIHDNLSLDFMPRPGEIKATDEGILYYVSENNSKKPTIQYYICKPSTKQWWPIPSPKIPYFSRFSTMKVLKTNPLHFKIFRFLGPYQQPKPSKNEVMCFEIFDSNTWNWKQGKKVELSWCEIFGSEPAIFVNNSFHWLTNKRRILAYQIEQETWSIISVPRPICENHNSFKGNILTKYQGKLAMCWINNNKLLELWVLNNEEWVEKRSWDAKEIRFPTLAEFYSSEIVMEYNQLGATFHDLQKGTSDVNKLKGDWGYANIFSFQTDYIPVPLLERGMQKKRQKTCLTSDE